MENDELIKRCFRIFYIARKPTDAEFKTVAKVTLTGMVVLGVIGLIVNLLFHLIDFIHSIGTRV